MLRGEPMHGLDELVAVEATRAVMFCLLNYLKTFVERITFPKSWGL
jgi:hypothetical protein